MQNIFVYFWMYIVKDEYIYVFQTTYGTDGEGAKYYIQTNLFRDAKYLRAFIVIDDLSIRESREYFIK